MSEYKRDVFNKYGDHVGYARREDVSELGLTYVPYGLFNNDTKEQLPAEDTMAEAVMAVRKWSVE